MTGLPVIAPQSVNLHAVLPLVWIAAGILFTLLFQFAVKGRARVLLPLSALAFLVGAFVASVRLWGKGLSSFDGSYSADNFALFAGFIFLTAAILTICSVAASYSPLADAPGSEGLFASGEVFPLMLTVVAGAIVMAASRNLILTFIGLETLSIPLYVLAGMNLDSNLSKEASLKYFLMGAFASGFFAYGISLFYGATGALDYQTISKAASSLGGDYTLFAGLALVGVGFAFKIALVPFHAWVPDVYQGSPALVSGFMASLVKAAGFAAVLRFMLEAAGGLYDVWWLAATVLTVLTMTFGNLLALNQTVLKRLLAYSSIAHAGYLLLALLALEKEPDKALSSALFYLAGYALSVFGAFAVIWWITPREKDSALTDMSDVSGLASQRPFAAWMLSLFLLSLAGIPITAGFLGKLYLFWTAFSAGYGILVIVALLNAVVSAFYYLKVLVAMFMSPAPESRDSSSAPSSGWVYVSLWIAAAGTIWLGVAPQAVLSLLHGLPMP